MFTYETQPASFPYPPAEAANLEYSILSTILGNSPDSGTSAGSPSAPAPHSHAPAANAYVAQQSPTNTVNSAWPATNNGYAEQQPPPPNAPGATPGGYIAPQYQQSAQYSPPASGTPTTQGFPEYAPPSQQAPAQTSSIGGYAGQPAQAPVNHVAPTSVQLVQRQPAIAPTRSSSATLIDRTVSTGTASWAGPPPSDIGYHDGSSVYKSVTKPYDYTEGYHFLMKHLPTRYVVLRGCRAVTLS